MRFNLANNNDDDDNDYNTMIKTKRLKTGDFSKRWNGQAKINPYGSQWPSGGTEEIPLMYNLSITHRF